MQRTFNYTGRRKIEQKEAAFSFVNDANTVSFTVRFDFDTNQYPDDASVYVEAHYKETRQRFYFGKISKLSPPDSTELTEVDLTGPILFSVLIVDESNRHGLLLASGHSFRADLSEDDQNKSSILTVVQRPLGQVTWQLSFETGGPPELCLNSRIPEAIEKIRSDATFQSLILPAALRHVLLYYLWNEETEEDENVRKWMEFATYFGDERPSDTDPQSLMNWVDDVVTSFSEKFEMCDRLIGREGV